ncbi:DNA mismatch repair endonuclease MutL [Pseudaestuariivita sp.]|uniref:DNA mismatch repair endonuclease MutL n=1 Tax=Pseudaestuariivita sp. TaxID=2211669 RepID=UPI00405969AC
MNQLSRNISTRPVIRQLDETAINRIAAGEVVERPASAVKELVENALDAGATRIEVDVAAGGTQLIRVTDDGCGMTREELPLALSRHATSKIDGTDLLDIRSFGFRGEALPSLGAVGRLKLTSRAPGYEAHALHVEGGKLGPVKPAALRQGTVIELRDLFYATPARLKFMRSERAEMQAVTDVVKRLAMAEPFVAFTLTDRSDGKARQVFRADAGSGDLFGALQGRLRGVLGRDFVENAVPLDATREALHLTGFAALPTYSRGAAVSQFLFVNGRPVRDRMLLGALRAAYHDLLPRDRHAAAALFVECPPELVDVNVHPAKSEVRFRDPGVARGLIVSGVRHALAEHGHRSATTIGQATLGAVRPEPVAPHIYQMDLAARHVMPTPPRQDTPGFAPSARAEPVVEDTAPQEHYPLGVARGQVHACYIVSQTKDGMILVDQHAAHERLIYERLKRQMAEHGVASQAVLIPDVVELEPEARARLLNHAEALARLGLVLEAFGGAAVVVRETPAALGPVDAGALVRDILDELDAEGDSALLQVRIDAIFSRMACHGSVRAGRQMRVDEMNALLREMEATPHSGQCNHGRPTYVELKLSDVERLFGRS